MEDTLNYVYAHRDALYHLYMAVILGMLFHDMKPKGTKAKVLVYSVGIFALVALVRSAPFLLDM